MCVYHVYHGHILYLDGEGKTDLILAGNILRILLENKYYNKTIYFNLQQEKECRGLSGVSLFLGVFIFNKILL